MVAAVPVVEDPGAGAPPVAEAPGLYANVRAQAWRLGGSSSSVFAPTCLASAGGCASRYEAQLKSEAGTPDSIRYFLVKLGTGPLQSRNLMSLGLLW